LRVSTLIRAMALTALFAGMSVAGVKYVAVVETDVDASSGASEELNPAEIRLITAELRRQATENLPSGRYSVMTSETVMSMGGAVLEECAEENCVIALGSKIGADYIVRGTISKFQTIFTLDIELYETDNGTLIASSEAIRSENLGELLNKAAVASANMYRKFAGVQAQTAVTTQSTNEYAANTYNNNSLSYQYKDFSVGQRFGTWGLNTMSILPTGAGSFSVMNDYIGGGIQAGAGVLCVVGIVILATSDTTSSSYDATMTAGILSVSLSFLGGHIFSIIRSITYHKPHPKSSAAAANFNPYDGLKLAILPTESGDYKVYARYDYTF